MIANGFKRTFLYEQVAEALGKDLEQFPTDERLQSDEILAKRYSVSLAIMRKALRILSKNGAIIRKQRLGSFVNEGFMRRRALKLPLAITLDLDPSAMNSSFFYGRLAERLRAFMDDKGFRTRLYIGEPAASPGPVPPQTSKDFMEDIDSGALAGVLSTSHSHVFGKWAGIAVQRKLPVVGMYSDYPYSVQIRTRPIYEEAAKIIAFQGRRRVGLLNWHLPWTDPTGDPDEKAFAETLVKYGLEVNKKWVVSTPYPDPEGGWHAFKALWDACPEKPDAVFVGDDTLFASAATAMIETRAKVPDELLVVTHANKGSGMLFPFPLIAIAYDPEECAEQMGEMMLKLLREEEVVPPHTYLPFRTVSIEKAPASA